MQLSGFIVKRMERLGASKPQKLRELEERAKATLTNMFNVRFQQSWSGSAGKGGLDESKLFGDLDAC